MTLQKTRNSAKYMYMVPITKKIFSFPTLTLLVALTLSAIAAWYSVLGLTAIFAAAVIPIIIMGGSLEIAKVVTTVWLHRYWHRAGWKLKMYLVPAVFALAFLTSMGIFGFLSKSHSDQALVSGDVSAKVELVDEKIKIARENIAMNQQALEQMNNQVDQLLGRTEDDKGANRAVQVRRQQSSERNRLNKEIEAEQAKIALLNEEVAPIRAEIRKVEAEVGPIKYIAAIIYGDNPDSNLLERAVRWVIILIVCVFDPLALVLVLAAQSSYRWLQEDHDSLMRDLAVGNNNDHEDNSDNDTADDAVDPVTAPDEASPAHPEEVDQVDQPLEQLLEEVDAEQVPTDSAPPKYEIADEIVPVVVEPEPLLVKEEPNTDIVTEGITIMETDGNYVQYQGKSISKDALAGIRPELFNNETIGTPANTNFGVEFPTFAKKGDIFVRVDLLPNKSYRFNGKKWFEINKDQATSYLYDIEYIKYLVNKIETGEYDVELLSDNEREQIEEYLGANNDK